MGATRLFFLVGLVLGLFGLTGRAAVVGCVMSLRTLRVLWDVGLLFDSSIRDVE